MIFSRRALQRRLDEVRDALGPEAASELANRLNRPHKDRMAAMWELVILHGLSKCGSLASERALATGKRPDIHLTWGALQLTADVTSVSDDGLEEDNPIQDFAEALEAAKKKLNLPMGGIDLKVHSKEVHTARGTKTALKLPRRQELREYVQKVIIPRLSEQLAAGASPLRLAINDDEVGIDLLIDPNKPGSNTYSYNAYDAPRIKDRNPLYAALKKKANQLRSAEGLRGIIVGDGGCRAIKSETRNWDVVTTQQILTEFFRQHQSIDFVVLLTVPDRPLTLFATQRPPLKIDSKIFHRENLSVASELKALFDAALDHFPKPAMTPINGALRARESGYDLGHHGGYTLAGSTIRMSLREFTEVFAGLRTLSDNGARNVEAARRLGREPDDLAQAVLRHVMAGRLPDSIKIVQTDEDDNDDWVEIHFGRADPAISPLK